ncbi:hypothetical protein GO730_04045 [Spirosoma sp. HMF3257]|uniref:SprB repeat-containing protein n=1 Tax=Spirosoma telluris TaxID=2183553 RepID=A0A327NER7_9BACT|nr:hypothetical protein [Spirosoma telluris]RAI73771.1 hypothetical protein HMF3257_03985 [Spirosoma telluris]
MTGVIAGVYSVTVTDKNGCTSGAQSFTVTEPSAITAVVQPTGALCPNNTGGTLTIVSITGGTGPYSWTWSTGVTQATSLTGLPGGTYTLNVSDLNGCPAVVIATVSTPTCPTVCVKPVLTVGSPVCNGSTYSISFYSDVTSITASAGTVDLVNHRINGISVGTPVSVTAVGGGGCVSVETVTSPASCATGVGGCTHRT